jgi:ATP-binding cassette subfamily B protein
MKLRAAIEPSRRTFALAARTCPAALALVVGGSAFTAVATPAIAYTSKRMVDAVVAGATRETALWVLVELLLVASVAVLGRVRQGAHAVMKGRLALELKTSLAAAAQGISLQEFEEPAVYERVVRARASAEARPSALLSGTLDVIEGGSTLLLYVVLLAQVSAWSLLLLLFAVPATIAEIKTSSFEFEIDKRRTPEMRRMVYFEDVLMVQEHAPEVRFFDVGRFFLSRWRRLGESFLGEDRRRWLRAGLVVLPATLLAPASLYVSTAIMAVAVARGAQTMGTLMLFWTTFSMTQRYIERTLAALRGANESRGHVAELFALVDRRGAPEAAAGLREAARARDERGLRFEGVGFRYQRSATWALRDVSFAIRPGEFVALVGSNGSGKTTLLKLILGLYEPVEGRVLFDGVDVRRWDRAALRRRFSAMFQSFERFQLSVRENVVLGGAVASEAGDPSVRDALGMSGASEFIDALPGGLDAELGRALEGCVELSGGQWQRLALARALVRGSADVLVLDEPTSALDPRTEQQVFRRLRALTPERTVLMTSHRPQMLRKVDRIIVLAGGRQLDAGSYEELVARGTLEIEERLSARADGAGLLALSAPAE